MSDWQDIMAASARAAGLAPRVDRFLFLRHGQTEYNRRHIVQGWADIPLNFTGEEQARQAARALHGAGITHVFASPLSRARRTAEIIGEAIGTPVHRLDERLREKHFGEYEHNPDPSPSVWSRLDRGAEGYDVFALRCAAGFNEALTDGIPLVVAHGGVRRILLWALGLQQEGAHMGNAIPLEFTRVRGVWQVRTLPAIVGKTPESSP